MLIAESLGDNWRQALQLAQVCKASLHGVRRAKLSSVVISWAGQSSRVGAAKEAGVQRWLAVRSGTIQHLRVAWREHVGSSSSSSGQSTVSTGRLLGLCARSAEKLDVSLEGLQLEPWDLSSPTIRPPPPPKQAASQHKPFARPTPPAAAAPAVAAAPAAPAAPAATHFDGSPAGSNNTRIGHQQTSQPAQAAAQHQQQHQAPPLSSPPQHQSPVVAAAAGTNTGSVPGSPVTPTTTSGMKDGVFNSSSSSTSTGRKSIESTSPEAASSSSSSVTPLRRLRLGKNLPKAASVVAWAGPFMPQLQHLDLSHNRIGDAGALLLAGSAHHWPGLASLNLSHNELGDEGVRSLCRMAARHWPGLQSLNLGDNFVGRSSAGQLAEALEQWPGLVALYLGGNVIDSDLVASELIAAVAFQCPCIEALVLSRNPFDVEATMARCFALLPAYQPVGSGGEGSGEAAAGSSSGTGEMLELPAWLQLLAINVCDI
jgi:hypothetical protein